ncbi:hypothetical protein PDIDSM_2256 [Penicillium digitatum]|nr:hypothetical protein PDIDSM_2256 [Penicillium digitatum]
MKQTNPGGTGAEEVQRALEEENIVTLRLNQSKNLMRSAWKDVSITRHYEAAGRGFDGANDDAVAGILFSETGLNGGGERGCGGDDNEGGAMVGRLGKRGGTDPGHVEGHFNEI